MANERLHDARRTVSIYLTDDKKVIEYFYNVNSKDAFSKCHLANSDINFMALN